VQLSGRIPAGEKPETGRAVGRLDGIGWGSALRDLLAADGPDGEVPVPLRHAVVQVLDGWLPAASGSVDGVVFIESDHRPALVRHLATGLARYRSLPLLTTFEIADHRPPIGATNSARRLAAVIGRHRLADPAAVAGKRILLVDDATDTGWTLTVAARELRRAGASAVYPLVLAVR
jgi:ATP-dependent DNA helicase RecQ